MNEKSRKKRIKLIIILAVAFLVLYYGATITATLQQKMSYNDFMQGVKDGTVEDVDIDSASGKVTFKVKGSTSTWYTNYPYSDDFVETLLVHDVEVKIHETNWLMLVLKYGTTPLMVGVMLLVLAKSVGVGKVGQQASEVVGIAKTTFADIAGMDELKEDLKILADMMKDDRYRASGARIPRGILLEGPPGNGKTLLAKAFAGEAGVNFIAVNACDFSSKFVGVGSDKIKSLFTEARNNAPCVVFIDEIDAVGAKRSAHQDAAGKEMNTILTALLNQMDGFMPMENVMVLAATNRAADLDSALVRPGRFDRQFVVDYPDKKTRMELFKLYTAGKKISEDVNFDTLVRRTYGYSCAKIECIINEALILAVTHKHEAITEKDFEDAILQMDIKGHLRKSFVQSDAERKTVAYHEAGHAVLGHFFTGKKVSNISIIPTTSGAGGFTITEEENDDELRPIEEYLKEIVMLYGGRAAETRLMGSVKKASAGASQDIRVATKLATVYAEMEKGIHYAEFGSVGVKTVMTLSEKILSEAWQIAQDNIDGLWQYVDAVAKQLMEKETLTEAEFLEIIESVQNPSPEQLEFEA